MSLFYLAAVVLHLIAMATWLGGMLFLVTVVIPWLRKGDRARAAALLQETGERFRAVGWLCFATILVTGVYLLAVRGVTLAALADPAWRASPYGKVVLGKLLTFTAIVGLSAIHDFRVGPRATEAVRRDPSAPEAERLRRMASHMGRLNLLLGLLMLVFAVQLVRGSAF